MELPKVIFLDAVGTLVGIKGSIGEIYSSIARQAGVEASPDILDKAFIQCFKNQPPLIFSRIEKRSILESELQWWRTIVWNTFLRAGSLERFSDFDDFFGKLYAHFATPSPWFVYPDVVPALQKWQKMGIELGIISNFDARLDRVIELFELKQFFSSITIPSIAGAAKPDNQIFIAALQKHDCKARQAWHIGDSLEEDYHGAKAVGIKPFLLRRSKI